MSKEQQTVLEFVEACNANDVERMLGFFAPDCVYHNIPVPAVRGVAAIRAVLDGFMGMASEVDWVVHHIADSGTGVVLTERSDRFKIGAKWVELPVMGTFEVSAGKITAWRDYFDMQQFQRQLPSAQ